MCTVAKRECLKQSANVCTVMFAVQCVGKRQSFQGQSRVPVKRTEDQSNGENKEQDAKKEKKKNQMTQHSMPRMS